MTPLTWWQVAIGVIMWSLVTFGFWDLWNSGREADRLRKIRER